MNADNTMSANLNDLRVELHGHAGVDTSGMKDVTQFVSAIRIGHAINPPWDTMTVQLQLPRHLLDLVLTGDPGEGGHRHVHTGGWVVVRAMSGTGDKYVGGPAIGFGCIENMRFAFQDIGGIADAPVQGTTAVVLDCISWFTAAGRSNVRLAVTDDKTTVGGVQDATSWFPIIAEAISNSTDPNLGRNLQQLWEKVCAMQAPDTLSKEVFGKIVPIVWDKSLAGTFAPARRGAMLPVRGQSFLNLPVLMPENDLWQWLAATFVPDANIVELFPSLEYPLLEPKKGEKSPVMHNYNRDPGPESRHGDDILSIATPKTYGTSKDTAEISSAAAGVAPLKMPSGEERPALTDLGDALGGANPVIIYRVKPYLMHPINEKTWGHPTMSERLKINQVPVDPSHTGPASEWYNVQESEALSMDVQYSESERVNLTFVRPTYMQTGALRAYTQVGQVVMPRPADFVRYGLRAYEPSWPYIPEGTPVSAAETQAWVQAENAQAKNGILGAPAYVFGATQATGAGIMDDFSAMNELVWALCGSAERFAHATLRTRAKPWCRAGHWIKGTLGAPAGGGPVTFVNWTGYIEAVEHTFEVDRQARLHTGSVFRLARVSFSRGGSAYFTPIDSEDKALAGEEGTKPPDALLSKVLFTPQATVRGTGKQSRDEWLRQFANDAAPICAHHQYPLSLCLAQAVLESQWGEKHFGKANNYFGIKASGKEAAVSGASHEYINKVKTKSRSRFRSFASQQACIQGYIEKMTRAGSAWIPPAGSASSVPARALWIWAGAGYATADEYMASLRGVSKQISGVLGDPSLEIKFTAAQLTLEKELVALPAWVSTAPTGVVAQTFAAVISVFTPPAAQQKYISIYPRKTRANQVRAAGAWPL